MKNKIKPKIKAKIQFFVFKEGNSFVAYSPALDISSCGSTEQEARKMFKEAAEIFIEEITEMGTVTEVLEDRGWRKSAVGPAWSPPEYKQESVQIAVGSGD
jgi:predicted RNase H-like HicB family nuclease